MYAFTSLQVILMLVAPLRKVQLLPFLWSVVGASFLAHLPSPLGLQPVLSQQPEPACETSVWSCHSLVFRLSTTPQLI
jgi:hypothetical protein